MGIRYDKEREVFVESKNLETCSVKDYRTKDFFYNVQAQAICKDPSLIGKFAYEKFRKSNGFGNKSPAEGALRKSLIVERQTKVCNSLQAYLLEFNFGYKRLL